MWNIIPWVLDACAFVCIAIGYWGYTRKANRIPLPDFASPPMDPEHEREDALLWFAAASRHTQRMSDRLDERIALRDQALRWDRRGLLVVVASALVTLGHMAWLWL